MSTWVRGKASRPLVNKHVTFMSNYDLLLICCSANIALSPADPKISIVPLESHFWAQHVGPRLPPPVRSSSFNPGIF